MLNNGWIAGLSTTQLVYKSKARVLSELLCRATCEESLSLKDSLIECLEHVKVRAYTSYYKQCVQTASFPGQAHDHISL